MDRASRRSAASACLESVLVATLFIAGSGCGMGVRRVGDGPRNAVRLEKELRQRITRSDSNVQAAISLVDLETGLRLGINDHVPVQSSGAVRIPVLLEVFRQIDDGKLGLDEPIAVRNQFVRGTDGRSYSLTAAADDDSTLYRLIGGQLPLRELLRAMIGRSSDLATQLLIERVTPAAIRATLSRLDAGAIRVVDEVTSPADNTVTADAIARALEAIARCRIHTRASCEEMVRMLAADTTRELLPAGVPRGAQVAHVTERQGDRQHDAGIVFPLKQKPYVLVILTSKARDRAQAAAIAGDLSRIVFDNLTEPLPTLLPRR